MIYFTSDLHLGEDDHLKQISSRFGSMRDYEQYVRDYWHSVVKPDDEVYVIGDIGNPSFSIIDLPGIKHLIIGNREEGPYESSGKAIGGVTPEELGKLRQSFRSVRAYNSIYSVYMLSHLPLHSSTIYDGYINVHGHQHTGKQKLTKRHFNVAFQLNDFQFVASTQIV